MTPTDISHSLIQGHTENKKFSVLDTAVTELQSQDQLYHEKAERADQ